MKVGLYSITYLGIWYNGPALTWKETLHKAKEYGYDGVEFDGKRPHANPMDWDRKTRDDVRNEAEKLGLELPAIASNNDFSSPVPEHRECQLLMVREQARLAADLGAKVVRLFAAWPGVTFRDGLAHYEEARQTWQEAFQNLPRQIRWRLVRQCLKEAAAIGEEFGVVMALQNHAPIIRHWKDCYDLVKEVNSPWLKVCLDLPIMTNYEKEWVRQAALTVGNLQVHSHFGGEFRRDDEGKIQLQSFRFAQPVPDYAHFIELMKEIGYDGYICFEFCHPTLDENHNPAGIDYVDKHAAMAAEYMRELISTTR
ncbi:TPA: sugar phosphate isomerase/epimerase [Candidatus Poribacteria bacterium]|nr:sugar phosphate isomerase/epimerase [Candidatus Poribacteria bacterium]